MHKKYYGIKGWLLFFLIILFINVLNSIHGIIDSFSNNVTESIIEFDIIFGIYSLSLAILIILKKKISVLLVKIMLFSIIGIAILAGINNLISGNIKHAIIIVLSVTIPCCFWLSYFTLSKRVSLTLTK